MGDRESSTTQLIETIREAMSKMTEQRYPTTAEAMLRRAWNEGGNSEGAVAFIRENFDKSEDFWRRGEPRKSPVFKFGGSSSAGGDSPSAQATPEVETLRRKIKEKEATKVMLQSMGEDSTQLDNEIADLQTRIEQQATKAMLQSMREGSTHLDNEIADLQTRIEQGDAMAELWNEWTKETMVTMILELGGGESKETLSSLGMDKLWKKLKAAGITRETFLERLKQGQGGGYRKKRQSKNRQSKKRQSKKRKSKKRQSKKRQSTKRKSRKRLKTRKRR